MDDRDFHTGLVMNYIGPKEQTSSLMYIQTYGNELKVDVLNPKVTLEMREDFVKSVQKYINTVVKIFTILIILTGVAILSAITGYIIQNTTLWAVSGILAFTLGLVVTEGRNATPLWERKFFKHWNKKFTDKNYKLLSDAFYVSAWIKTNSDIGKQLKETYLTIDENGSMDVKLQTELYNATKSYAAQGEKAYDNVHFN